MSNEVYTAELRTELLEQVAYLGDEVEALRAVIDRVPQPVLEGRPLEGDRSISELFGLLAVRDQRAHRPFVQRVVAEDEPHLERVDEEALLEEVAWNERSVEAILEEVYAARMELVEALRALPAEAWRRGGHWGDTRLTLYELAHAVTQEDAEVLRTIGHRLHASNLSGGRQNPPK